MWPISKPRRRVPVSAFNQPQNMKNEPFFKYVAAAIFAGVILAFGNLSTDSSAPSPTKPDLLAAGRSITASARS